MLFDDPTYFGGVEQVSVARIGGEAVVRDSAVGFAPGTRNQSLR